MTKDKSKNPEKKDERDEIIDANKDLFDANQTLQAELDASKLASDEQAEKMKAEIDALIAKSIPVSTPKRHDAMDVEQVKGGVADFNEAGDLIKPVLGDINDPIVKEKIAMEEFMTDMVTVNIQGSHDIRHSKTFPISVNGETEIFTSGETRTVQRKFVEGLCRAKNPAYANVEMPDGKGGTKFVYDPTNALRFGFSVMEDPHPRGSDWLKHTLRQE